MQKKIIVAISAMVTLVIASTMFLNFHNTKISENENDTSSTKISENENDIDNTEFTTYKIGSDADVLWVSPEALYENSDLVVLVDYESDIKSYPSESGIPMTLSNFNVKKVYKGNLERTTTLPVNYRGGSITLEEYLTVQPQSRIAKQEFYSIPKEKAKYTLIEYESSVQDFSLKETPENYILFLYFDEDFNAYTTLSGDYGISKVNEKGQMYDYLNENYVDISFDK